MPHRHQSLLEFIERLDVGARRTLREQPVLDGFQFGLEQVEDREIPVYYRIDQRVQHIPRTDFQQLRFAFAACTHLLKAALCLTAHREHVVATREHRDLSHAQFFRRGLDRLQHRKQAVAVVLDFRSLVSIARILDRQWVQVELRLHLLQDQRVGIAQRNPYQAVWLRDIAVNFGRLDVGLPVAVPVDDSADQHGAILTPLAAGNFGARKTHTLWSTVTWVGYRELRRP